MTYYLDSNAIVSLFHHDGHTPKILSWLAAVARGFHVSSWAEIEFCAVLLRDVRNGTLSETTAAAIFKDLESWLDTKTQRLGANPVAEKLALSLVREAALKLSAPDALHLALAMTAQLTLVTFDLRLADAARSKSHPVVVP